MKPSPGADDQTSLPVKTFGRWHSARGAEVAGSYRTASLHDPRAHEQRHVNANKIIAQQTSRASHRALRVGWGLRNRLTDEKNDAVVGGVACLCQQAHEFPRRRGAYAKGNTTKSRLVGLAAGEERCIAWRRGAHARPVVLWPNLRANSARRNPRITIRQQRRGHPGRLLWRTEHQGRVKVLKYELSQARRGRGRTGWLLSGQARRQERGT